MHVAVVGGSVSWGQGRVTPGGDYGARFVSWLNATWPSPHHRFTNAAKPAVTSALYALCAHTLIPQVPGRPAAWCWARQRHAGGAAAALA